MAACDTALPLTDCRASFTNITSGFRLPCYADSAATCSSANVETYRKSLNNKVDIATAPAAKNAYDPQHVAAFNCRVQFGLDISQDCPSNCSSNGVCGAGGCHCNSGWTGDDCATQLPASTNPTGGIASVHQQYSTAGCDNAILNTPAMAPITYDNCTVWSGMPGVFNSDANAKPMAKSVIRTCADRGVGLFCMFNGWSVSHSVTCNGKGDSSDNKYWCCNVPPDYSSPPPPADSPKACLPLDSSNILGPGKCVWGPPFATQSSFEAMPCALLTAQYNINIPDGQSRFYCIGVTKPSLLQCPQNVVTQCANNCVSKYTNNDVTQPPTGAAACCA